MNHEARITRREARTIQICSWCLPATIRVLGLALGVEAVARISFELDGSGFPRSAHTIVRGEVRDLVLSHGICPECAGKLRPQTARVQ